MVSPAAPRDLITVELANHSIDFAPQIRVYDGNLRIVNWGEKAGPPASPSASRAVRRPIPPVHRGLDANPCSGQYVLTVKPQQAFDAYEPNDDILSARRIGIGEDIHANIMDADDSDFYSFRSPRKGTVAIDIQNSSSTLIPAITLYTGERRRNLGFGPELRQPGANLQHTMKVEKDLMYYVQVWSQAGTSGAYTLRVN